LLWLIGVNAGTEDKLEKFLSIIPKPSENPGVTGLTEHHIDVRQKNTRQATLLPCVPKVQEAIRDEVDRMLEAGIIEPSYSEWSNSIVMVKKSNGKYRFCLDFRKIKLIKKRRVSVTEHERNS